MKTELQGDP